MNEAVNQYEKKVTNEIKYAQNRSKNLHMYIRKLRGEKIRINSKIEIYDEQGIKMEEKNIGTEVKTVLEGHIPKT